MKIDRPGVYEISAEDYHADPCPEPSLSASIAKLLVTPGGTPLHAWHECPRLNLQYEADERTMFDLGAAAHSLLLNDERAFEVMDFADWRSKEARNLRDEARALGKIPILTEQWERTIQMVEAARNQLAAHEEAKVAFQPALGRPEQTIVWTENGFWCRARLDWLPNSGRLFFDYKSTSASADPDCWAATMFGMGADFQLAFYTRGLKKLGICADPLFRFVVQENFKPFALSVVGLMPGAIDLAARDVEIAIDRWSDCVRFNQWPGYPRKTCFVDSPPWREAQKMAREEREHASETELRRAADVQAPL